MTRSIMSTKPLLSLLLYCAGCAVFFVMRCAPVIQPSHGTGSFDIQLGLEDGTKTSSIFSGAPVTAVITLAHDTTFDAIAWHLGSAYYTRSDVSLSTKSKTFSVQLFWKTMPLLKDTATKLLYDTIYVSIAGESQRSNSVKVYVTNIAPVIDSVKIGTTKFNPADTIRYILSVTDTQTQIAMKVAGHDVNLDVLGYEWYSALSASTVGTANILSYQEPSGLFSDTLMATVYDGKGGSAKQIIILTKLPPDNPPQIDSIHVGGQSYVKDSTVTLVAYSALSLDSLPFRVYASDKDAGDVISIYWSHKNSRDSLLRSLTVPSMMVMRCDTMYRKAISRDSARTVDTVLVLVKDQRGDSSRLFIRVVQGHVNTPPRIDSLSVKRDSVIFNTGTALSYRDTLRGKDTLRIRVYTTDIDTGDTVHLVVRAAQQSQVQIVGDTIVKYACKDSLYKDSIVIFAHDIVGDSSAKKSVVVIVNDRSPVIDSLATGDTGTIGKVVFHASDAAFVRTDTIYSRDSLLLQLYSHDPDALDTTTLSWSAAHTGALVRTKNASGSFAVYICDSTSYSDTVRMTVTDKKLKTTIRTLVVHIQKGRRDNPPRIDSIRYNNITQCKGAVTVYRDSASGKDSVFLRFYTSDPDSGDTVHVSIAAKAMSCLSMVTDTGCKYTCIDSIYKDSIVVTAKDIKGDSVKKSVVISIVNRLPVIDSIRATDTLLATARRDTLFTGTDSVFVKTDSLAAKDSIKIRVFAHDPDALIGDSITTASWVLSSGNAVKKLDTKGLYVQYPCRNALYSDTLNVKVYDRKIKWVQKKIILNVK